MDGLQGEVAHLWPSLVPIVWAWAQTDGALATVKLAEKLVALGEWTMTEAAMSIITDYFAIRNGAHCMAAASRGTMSPFAQ
jgi:hypothetical protein